MQLQTKQIFSGKHNLKPASIHAICLFFLRHLIFVLALGIPLAAQTNEELFREYQFNFDIPGARARGMGGAFIGTADDATASFANPAGLAFLSETAITLEWRTRRLDAQEGALTGVVNSFYKEASVDLDSVNFLSFNFRWRGWYFGIFQFGYLDEKQKRDFTSRSLAPGEERIESRSLSLALEGTSRGFGVARRFGNLKLGLSANHLEFKGLANFDRESFFFAGTPASTRLVSSIDDSDQAWGLNLGAHHMANDHLSWGVVYRYNPKFSLQEAVTESENGIPTFVDEVRVPFAVPDVLGAGLSYRLRPDLRFALDWQRVFYSEIVDDGFVIVESIQTERRENYTIDDADELHAGFEWLIPLKSSVWAIRSGYFHNPQHPVRYRGDDPFFKARFSETQTRDENHLTIGVGWVLLNKFEVDLAADFWEQGREFKVSFIWRNK